MSDTQSSQGPGKTCPQCGNPLPAGVLDGLCPACLLKQGAAADTAFPNEAAGFQPPDIAEVARMFPQLEILSLLGKGGMGAVYKARQPSLDRFVALKILPPQTGMAPGFVERFNREARALAKLTHPNIVTVHEFGQVNGMPFFIMEFVDGLNLRELERAGKLSPREALQIVPQICEALQFAHDEGIVHRDIKPENILVDKKGRVKIADFGIAKILGGVAEPSLTETRGTIGTPNYMAPEQMEKPSTVDHRADIFSLGVVFYEMLTGELPLGKFSPPSERKIAVDVRLDDVVLRALEKDPERRYQQASQVRTAVNEITSTAPPPVVPPTPAATASATAEEILARDYHLSIRSCYRRAWALLRKEFWPILGITLLMLALVGFASGAGTIVIDTEGRGDRSRETSALALLVYGPLMGGLSLYYLKKIRGEATTVETAFSGFGNRFLHLFLAGFVSWILTALGFACLILPGLYLWVAWMFALTIVIDQRLDFWSALELSRKVVTRHWFKLFGLLIVGGLWCFLGVICLFFGLLIAIPFVLIAFTYAYEDIFGAVARAASPAPAPALGPVGTVVSPVTAIKHGWKRIPTAGFVALTVAILAIVIFALVHRHRDRERIRAALESDSEFASQVEAAPSVVTFSFGPVMERSLQARRDFLNLESGKIETLPIEIADALGNGVNETEARLWEGLDIAENSPRFKYVNWLSQNGADVMYVGDGKIIGFNGVFQTAHGPNAANWDDWNAFSPDEVRNAIDTGPNPNGPSGLYHSATRLESRESGGPEVSLLTRDQSVNYFFKTSAGTMGILQLGGFSDDRKTAKIRYKLIRSSNDGNASPANGSRASPEDLSARIDAALLMGSMTDKDELLKTVAVDAAKAGQVEIAKKALGDIDIITDQGTASLDVVRILINRGLRKQATEIAGNIMQIDLRDKALAEVAR